MTRLGTTCCLNSCGHGVVSPSTTVGYINYVVIYGFNVDGKDGRHALVGLSILTVHQESPNIGVLMPESKTFRA
jgi:hypothetical protein